MESIHKAINPPSKLTMDSTASESNPTEPVNIYAPDFKDMVAIAAAIESQANRVREGRSKFQPFLMKSNTGFGDQIHRRNIGHFGFSEFGYYTWK